MTDNEKLIEEAASAIHAVAEGGAYWGDARMADKDQHRAEARAALAVFEKAHTPTDNEKLIEEARGFAGTSDSARASLLRDMADALEAAAKAHAPTDDEREALVKRFADRIFAAGLRAPDSTKAVIAFKEIAAGFRRSEVPEPSAECPQCHRPAGLHKLGCGERFASQPQGEPSDAQAEAEANRRWPHTPGEPDTASARSARRLSFRQGVTWARAASAATAEPLRDHGGWDMSLQFKPGQGEPSDAQAAHVHRTYPSTEGQQEDDGIGLLGGAPRW